MLRTLAGTVHATTFPCRALSATATSSFAARRWASGVPKRVVRQSHYSLLGVGVTATTNELKQAYRKRALECHPDVVPAAKRASAEADFRRISEAYSVLSDPKQRPAYDRSLGLGSPSRSKTDESARSDAAGGSSRRSSSPSAAAWGARRRGPGGEAEQHRPYSPRRTPSYAERRAQSPSRTGRAAAGAGRPRAPSPSRGGVHWSVGGARGGMVRGDADAVFKEAFQGKSIHDIVFDARYAAKYGRDGRSKRTGTHRADGLAKSGSDVASETPEEAIQTTAADVARMYESRYRLRDPKVVRVHIQTDAGEPAPPPSSHMPFRPFAGTTLPEGVTAEGAPVAEEPVVLDADAEFRVETDTRTWRDLHLPRTTHGHDSAYEAPTAVGELARSRSEPHRMGQLRSFRRPE